MQILLTVDVELSPVRPFATDGALRENLRGAIYGGRDGRYGLPYQLDLLAKHDLRAVFFVEALSADVVGFECLAEIVALIRSAGQEVQLHAHAEWLRHMAPALRQGLVSRHDRDQLSDYDEPDQLAVLGRALDNLRQTGVGPITAFRAGSYGASAATLRALARLGLDYDTSYNVCYLDGPCALRTPEPLLECRRLEAVVEVPITFFDDRIFGFRPLQICAVSAWEMRAALVAAAEAGRRTAVVVSHSFELLNRARTRAHRIHVARFEALCLFLADQRDRMPTAWFSDLDADALARPKPAVPLRSSPVRTALRVVEQAAGRFYE